MNIRGDFAPKRTAGLWVASAAVLIALLGWVWLAHHYLGLLKREAAIPQVAATVQRAIPRERPEDIAAAARVAGSLTVKWATILNALEATVSDAIAVLALTPDAKRESITIQAEARNEAAMLAFVERLSTATAVTQAKLVRHQLQVQDPYKPVQFSVRLQVNPN